MTHVEELFGWLAYAEDTLRHAADAKSVLAYLKRDDPKTHSGVVGGFGELAVKGSDFPAPTAKMLARLFEHRLKADCDQAYRHTLTRETTAKEIGRAETFCGGGIELDAAASSALRQGRTGRRYVID